MQYLLNSTLLPIPEQKSQLSGEEQEKKISTYEEAMAKIKDATGVSDIQEVVQRFLSQGDTQKHLEQLKINNDKMLVRLKEEKVSGDCHPSYFLSRVSSLSKPTYASGKFQSQMRLVLH